MSRFRKILMSQTKINYILNGLVGWWKFDEGSGTTAIDSSGNGNNGTLTNGPTYVDGKIGKALNFDGSNDRIVFGDISLFDFTNSFSISVWVKVSGAPPTSQFSTIIGKGGLQSSTGFGGWAVFIADTGLIWFQTRYNTTVLQASSTLSIIDGNWHYITGIRNHLTNITMIYIDGIFATQASGALTNYSSTRYLTIGDIELLGTGSYGSVSAPATYEAYNGVIDDIRIYNRTLSESEITQIYNLQG